MRRCISGRLAARHTTARVAAAETLLMLSGCIANHRSSSNPHFVSVRWNTTSSAPSTTAAGTATAASAAAGATTAAATTAQQQQQQRAEEEKAFRGSAMATMERAAAARREIFDLWRTVSSGEEEGAAAGAAEGGAEALDAARISGVSRILDTYKIDPATPREEDICRGLGDALDRLLLLCVPLASTRAGAGTPSSSSSSSSSSSPSSATAADAGATSGGGGTDQLERILQATGRQGRKLSVRTVQHLFARTGTFAEALAVFYALRRCHLAMSMESYHAMLYSLQRLEEEGWALRFRDEVADGSGSVSEQALDFVLSGADNQLMPENKPWLGRVMFAERGDNAAEARQSRRDYDEMGKAWVERYKGGSSSSSIPSV